VGMVGGCEPGLGFILAPVCSVHGECRPCDWPFWRCYGVRCRGLGLAEAKWVTLASWYG
jgi:hypothetical protein